MWGLVEWERKRKLLRGLRIEGLWCVYVCIYIYKRRFPEIRGDSLVEGTYNKDHTL